MNNNEDLHTGSPKIMELHSTCNNVYDKKDIEMGFYVACLTIDEGLLNIKRAHNLAHTPCACTIRFQL